MLRATQLCRASFDFTEGVPFEEIGGYEVSEITLDNLTIRCTFDGSIGIWEKRKGKFPLRFNERWHKVFDAHYRWRGDERISITTFKRGDWEAILLTSRIDDLQAA
jgi:hypothetical protein